MWEVVGECLMCRGTVRVTTEHPDEWLKPKSVITVCPWENAASGVRFTDKRLLAGIK